MCRTGRRLKMRGFYVKTGIHRTAWLLVLGRSTAQRGREAVTEMSHLSLNCPRCQKQLVYVPLDGFVLHYECPEHGSLILRPLDVMPDEEPAEVPVRRRSVALRVVRAAR